MVWYFHLLKSFPVCCDTHSQSFSIVNEAEVDVFLELSCFFCDPTDIGNLISGSSAFSKSSLNIWKFLVHILLKPNLENFQRYLASMWNECNCAIVWTFFALHFFGIEMKTDFFQSCGHWWVFQICWHIQCSTFIASSFRIWNSSSGILEKAMTPHSSTLAWKIPWTEEPGGLQSMESLRVGHDWATSLSLFTFMRWRRKWQPTPVFLPGGSQGQGSLMGCYLWGRTESDTTEAT